MKIKAYSPKYAVLASGQPKPWGLYDLGEHGAVVMVAEGEEVWYPDFRDAMGATRIKEHELVLLREADEALPLLRLTRAARGRPIPDIVIPARWVNIWSAIADDRVVLTNVDTAMAFAYDMMLAGLSAGELIFGDPVAGEPAAAALLTNEEG